MRFDELDLADEVLDGLDGMNFVEMTPIQEASIPLLLEGRDIIACAQTGTGKTAAYLLPIIDRLSRGELLSDKVNAVVIAPTRELAIQIEQQVLGFSYYLPISSVAVYGGTDGITFEQQRRALELGVDIVIATPGRLMALLNLQNADLSSVSYFVLDEADRMLDMGFYDDIVAIAQHLPKGGVCQTAMFSATMPPRIKKLAATLLYDPAEVEIAISRPPESIRQCAYICHEGQKLGILKHIFSELSPERSIVFSSSKLKCKELARAISKLGINCQAMHSDRSQDEREQIMRDFKHGSVDLLVATDIVARGIDIDNISVVVNYDLPHDAEDYVHRIGRTARGNNDAGMAITLVGEEEQYGFGEIETFLGRSIELLPIPETLGEAPLYEPKRKRTPQRSRGAAGKRGGQARNASTPKGERSASAAPKRDNRNKRRRPAGKKPSGQGAPKQDK